MILAAYGDGLYKLFFLGHMLSFVVAFAPAVINPILAAQVKDDGEQTLLHVARHMADNGRKVHFPALIALGGFGLAMVFSSDKAWGFDQTWVSLAVIVWVVLCGLITGVLLPSERKLAAGDLEAEKKVALVGQIVTVLALVMLYLMIWKPGI
jgi:uncharacterized membrane protein